MINIAIADDHPLLLEGLKNILVQEDDLDIIGCYPDAETMHTALTQDKIDILLLDINLTEVNGLELIKPLLKQYPDLKIIMLSVHNEFAVINSAFAEGAHGYIQKNASIQEILTGIQEIRSGNRFLCKQTQQIVDRKNNHELKNVPKLTRREKEVLAEASLGLTTGQIAEKLFISPHTVESHRKNLIEKFKANNLSSAIKMAYEYGLI